MNIRDLEKQFPDAFNALPEAYRNDNCLEFKHEDGFLIGYPKEDQVEALGDWKVVFENGKWVDCHPFSQPKVRAPF